MTITIILTSYDDTYTKAEMLHDLTDIILHESTEDELNMQNNNWSTEISEINIESTL